MANISTVSLVGYIFGGVTIVSIIFLFMFLMFKQERLKKLPVWFYILAVLSLLMGLAAIGLIIGGGVAKSASSSLFFL